MDPFGWHILSGSKLLQIHERLKSFESMTWNEILVKAKKQHHQIDTDGICAEAQADLEANGIFLEKVVSLHLTGKERMWGYLEAGVLVLLWWDPDHVICPWRGANN